METWIAQVLSEVQKIDPTAKIVGDTGTPGDPTLGGSIHIKVNGVEIPIGNGTPIDQVTRLVNIYAPAPVAKPPVVVVAPPKPVVDDSAPFLENGRWFKIGIAGIKQSCLPPTAVQIAVISTPSIKPAVLDKIKAELVSDPPLAEDGAQALLRVYGFVLGLKG